MRGASPFRTAWLLGLVTAVRSVTGGPYANPEGRFTHARHEARRAAILLLAMLVTPIAGHAVAQRSAILSNVDLAASDRAARRPAEAHRRLEPATSTVPMFRQVRVVAAATIDDLAVGDFDRNGRADAVTIENGAGQIWTYRADTKLAFARQRRTTYADAGEQILGFAPFKKPGSLDLAAAAEFATELFALLPGRKTGRFQKPKPTKKGAGDADVDAGVSLDLDSNGRADLVVLLRGGDLIAFRNRGGFRFDRRVIERGSIHDGIAAADVDGDGNDDLIGIDLTTDTFTVYESKGDGTFRAGKATGVDSIGTRMLAADLDGDGDQDLIGDGNFFNDSWTMLNGGKGRFVKQVTLPGEDISGGAVTADFTGDGTLDLAAADLQGVALWEGRGNGTFMAPSRMAPHMRFDRNDGIFRPGNNIGVGDVDRDGDIDIIGAQFFGDIGEPPVSNLIVFLNGEPPVDLRITNLTFAELRFDTSFIVMRGSLSFSGSDGAVYWDRKATDPRQTAFLSFAFRLDMPFPQNDIVGEAQVSGPSINHRGESSGTIDFDMQVGLPVVIIGTQPTVTVSDVALWDNNLARSNLLLQSAAAQR